MPWQCQALVLLFVLSKNTRLQRRMRQRKKMRQWRALFTSSLVGEKSQSLDAIRTTLSLLVLVRISREGLQSLIIVKITLLLLTKWRMKQRWMLHSSPCARKEWWSLDIVTKLSGRVRMRLEDVAYLAACQEGILKRQWSQCYISQSHACSACWFPGGVKDVTRVDLHRTILQNLSHTNLNQQFSWTKGLTELQHNKLSICLIRDFCSHNVLGNSCTLISSYNYYKIHVITWQTMLLRDGIVLQIDTIKFWFCTQFVSLLPLLSSWTLCIMLFWLEAVSVFFHLFFRSLNKQCNVLSQVSKRYSDLNTYSFSFVLNN